MFKWIDSKRDWILPALRWSVVGVLLARAWQYVFWDGPWRALLWDESSMSGIIRALGWEWSDWAGSLAVERGITYFTMAIGGLFLLGAILAWSERMRARRWIWIGLALLLLVHSLLHWKGHAWQWGYLVEHSLQWTTPLWFTLLWPLTRPVNHWWQLAKLAIALTFIGHGLYAMGYYPVPPHFVGMMMNGFGLTEVLARGTLWWIGWIDVLAAMALFLPPIKVRRVALVYIIIWGLMTAMARLYANADWYSWSELASQWLPEFTVRWCHFLVPIALLEYWRKAD